MPDIRSLYPALRLTVACVILAIGLRTWLVMGLIEPVTVAGSSMVPTLRGAHVTPTCLQCGHQFAVGAEFAVSTDRAACPSCGETKVSVEGLDWQRGDRLWVDRLSLGWRSPERWETVVARNPDNAAELCVKRVVGLPGEVVDLRDGNVRIDGAVTVKSPAAQKQVRQPLHHSTGRNSRWQPDSPNTWEPHLRGWHHSPTSPPAVHWLRYQHPNNQPITDDVAYNAGLTRRLNLVDEFTLAANTSIAGNGSLLLAIDDGTSTAELRLRLPDGVLEVAESGRHSATLQLKPELLTSLSRKNASNVSIELSNFDLKLLLTINDRIVLRRPWPNTRAAGTSRPVAIGAAGLTVTLSELTLYRDIYHTGYPAAASGPVASRWRLGPGEYFLLGDNAPISADSRLWGPVPARLIVGKPLGLGR